MKPGLGRWFDLLVASSVLVVGAPLWLTVAAAIRLTSPGPALHRANRVGQHGQEFTMLKFRTMRVADGLAVTASGDPRITSIGRVLRVTKIDEIPQLINVVHGEMSIIGPRPEDPRYLDLEDPLHQLVLRARPGLTSAASVEYRHEERILAEADDVDRVYREKVLPEKLRIDAGWLVNRTIQSDLRLLFSTARAVVRRAPA